MCTNVQVVHFSGRIDMSKISTALLTLVIVLLFGCQNTSVSQNEKELNSSNNEPQRQKQNSITSLAVKYKTNALNAIIEDEENWLPGTYYAILHSYAKDVPTAIGQCNQPSPLFKGLKSFFGIKDVSEIIVKAKIVEDGKIVLDQIPLLFVAHYDRGENGLPYCVTKSFDGNLTPEFLFDADLSFNVEYEILFANTKDFTTAQKVLGYVQTIANYVNAAPVGQLAKSFSSDFSESLDDSLKVSFSSVSKDVITQQLKAKVAFQETRNDGLSIALGKALNSIGENSVKESFSINTELKYSRSVFGLEKSNGKCCTYPSSATRILSKKDAINKATIAAVIEQNKKPGINTEILKLVKDSTGLESIKQFCSALKNYLTSELELSDNDSLIARWAVMMEYSNYNDVLTIRNEKCFSKEEKEKLLKFNLKYRFRTDEDIVAVNQKPFVTEEITKLVRVMHAVINEDKLEDIFDIDKFVLKIDPESMVYSKTVKTESEEQEEIVFSGKAGIKQMAKLFEGAFCGARSYEVNKPEMAIVLRNRTGDDSKFLSPAAVTYDSTTEGRKIVSLWVLDADAIKGILRVSSSWPNNWNVSSCNNVQFGSSNT